MLPWFALVSLLAPLASPPQTARVVSQDHVIPVARVLRSTTLAERDGLTVNLTVVGLGQSTDVSPTEQAYLTLFLQNPMFSVDAAFDLGAYIRVLDVTRESAGIYRLRVLAGADGMSTGRPTPILQIDARQATVAIRAVDCGAEFDCDAAMKFRTSISVTKQITRP